MTRHVTFDFMAIFTYKPFFFGWYDTIKYNINLQRIKFINTSGFKKLFLVWHNTFKIKSTYKSYEPINKLEFSKHEETLYKMPMVSPSKRHMLYIINNKNKNICCNPHCNNNIGDMDIIYLAFDGTYCSFECRHKAYRALTDYW